LAALSYIIDMQHETHLQITRMCFSIDIRGSMMTYTMLFPCTNFKILKKTLQSWSSRMY